MLRHFVAEYLGTFALVFVVGLAVMMTRQVGADGGTGLLIVAAAYGLVVAALRSAFMRISGHFNPAVTVAFLATRRLEGMLGGVFLAAQVLGAVTAAYLQSALVPIALFTATRGGGPSVSLDITTGQAFALEGIAVFLVVFVLYGSMVDRGAPPLGGLPSGLAILVATLAIGPLTGAALNPARAFGPAVATGIWEAQLLYWVGPLLGGVLAGLLYDGLFLGRSNEPIDHGALKQPR